jgi:AbrB family looped-hinge helix DNA binding protein
METTRLSSRGQIVLPKSIRDRHAWKPGMEFEVEDAGDGKVLLRRTKRASTTTLDEVVGCLKVKGKRRTLAQMDAGAKEYVRKNYDRSRY